MNDLPPPEITVYNQNFGLVKEARRLNLQEGRQTVAVEDVAATVEPASVAIRPLDDPEGLVVLEQNYRYDLLDRNAVLARSVGERVRVVGERETVEGVLISSPGHGGGMILRADDGRIVLDPEGQVSLERTPEGLVVRPTLVWGIQSERAGERTVELSYVAGGLSWTADYVLTLDDGGPATLQGWVTLTNESGATWEGVRLKLLAGDVNRPEPVRREFVAMASAAVPAPMGGFQEQTLFEYHLYALGRPTTLANREVKQVALLRSERVVAAKRLVLDATRNFGRFFPGEGEIGTGDVAPQARLEFRNDADSGLALPLPAGRVRVMARDRDGSVQLLGEDRIGHTPREERVSLVVGRSFDVRATRTRTRFERLGNRGAKEGFAIEIRNRKDDPETVEVVERFWGQWRVTEASHESTKEDANTIRFPVALGPNETRTVTYTVESRW